MTLEQIITIDAIVREGSFKAAADFLHKSQPSISMAIKKLEEEYQITLFSRDEYRPSLTADGRVFYEKAKLLLKEYKELDSLGKLIGNGVEPEIRISVDAVSPVGLVLHFLRDFFAAYPDTKLTLKYEVLSGTIERLIEGDVDLAITPRPLDHFSSLEMKPMAKTQMVSVISSELVADKKKITDEFFKKHNQIILADSARKIAKASSGILEGGRNLTVNDMAFKKELIMQGLGWGGLPSDLIENELKSDKLTQIKTGKIKDREIEIFLVRNSSNALGPVTKKLWDSVDGEFLS